MRGCTCIFYAIFWLRVKILVIFFIPSLLNYVKPIDSGVFLAPTTLHAHHLSPNLHSLHDLHHLIVVPAKYMCNKDTGRHVRCDSSPQLRVKAPMIFDSGCRKVELGSKVPHLCPFISLYLLPTSLLSLSLFFLSSSPLLAHACKMNVSQKSYMELRWRWGGEFCHCRTTT